MICAENVKTIFQFFLFIALGATPEDYIANSFLGTFSPPKAIKMAMKLASVAGV